MIEEKVGLMTEVSSGIGSATAGKSVGSGGAQRELEDLLVGLNMDQSTDAASIVAALVCFQVGSGSGEVCG